MPRYAINRPIVQLQSPAAKHLQARDSCSRPMHSSVWANWRHHGPEDIYLRVMHLSFTKIVLKILLCTNLHCIFKKQHTAAFISLLWHNE